jgi:hypothetical protein
VQEKLIVAQIFKKFPAIYGISKIFYRVQNITPFEPYPKPDDSTPHGPILWFKIDINLSEPEFFLILAHPVYKT